MTNPVISPIKTRVKVVSTAQAELIDYDSLPNEFKTLLAHRRALTSQTIFSKYTIGEILVVEIVVSANNYRIMSHSKYEPEEVNEDIELENTEITVPKDNENLLQQGSGWYNDFYFTAKARLFIDTMAKIARRKGQQSIRLVGGSGYGKTAMAQAVATELGMDLAYLNCAVPSEPSDFLYSKEVSPEKGTFYVETEFAKCFQRGNAILVIDEVRRMKQGIANAMFSMFDFRHMIECGGKIFNAGKNIIFWATNNDGDNFVQYKLDAALARRLGPVLRVTKIPKKQTIIMLNKRFGINQTDANKIVEIFEAINTAIENQEYYIPASPAEIIQVGEMMYSGLTLRQALEFVLIEQLDEHQTAAINSVTTIVNSKTGERFTLPKE